jgi:Ca2+-binding RTX toxin-like protein
VISFGGSGVTRQAPSGSGASLQGTPFADHLTGADGQDTLRAGGAGEDRLTGGAGQDVYVLGQAGRLAGMAEGRGGTVVIVDDGGVLVLGPGDFPGAQIQYAREGNDLLLGDPGAPLVRIVDFHLHSAAWFNGTIGADDSISVTRLGLVDWARAEALPPPGRLAEGTAGADRLEGTAGADTLRGMDGADTLIGGEGDDFLYGGATEADLRDVMFGGAGNDTLEAGWGNDELNGGAGNDWLDGGFGSDTMIGNDGNDMLSGGAGSDLMFGGPGNDTLNGGFGFDRMNGGAGADRFFHLGVADHASDWVQDYNAADGDVLVFGRAGATRAQFQINEASTPNAGSAGVDEAFVIYRPTGQIMWALVDGAAQGQINVQIGGQVFDLLA